MKLTSREIGILHGLLQGRDLLSLTRGELLELLQIQQSRLDDVISGVIPIDGLDPADIVISANDDGSILITPTNIKVGVLATDAQHGLRGGGTQHPLAIANGASGFLSGADKTKVDASDKSYLFWGNLTIGSTTTPRFLTPGHGAGTAPTIPIKLLLPSAGILSNLKIRQNVPAGNGNSTIYKVRVNTVDSGLMVVLASTAFEGVDSVNSIAVNAGDTVDIILSKNVTLGTSPTDVTASLEVKA
jgi:hypothetical protein